MSDAIASGCERLVNPGVTEGSQRQSHRRFIGQALVAPFLLAGAAVTLATSSIGAGVTVAVIFAVFGLGWFTALAAATAARLGWTKHIALFVAALGIAGLVASAGGLASPVALLVLILPLEAFWVTPSRRAAIEGAVAGCGAIALQFAIGTVFPAGSAVPAAWHWLIPLAWAITFVPRAKAFLTSFHDGREHHREFVLEDIIDAAVFRFGRNGDVLDGTGKIRDLLNVAPELLTGTGLFDRVHVADRVAYLSALADMREGATRRKVDLRIRLPRSEAGEGGNNHRDFSLELAQPAATGMTIGILRSNDDVVELRRALTAAGETAASADVAKSRFLAAVSHELRTPLNAILGFSDMLLHEMFGSFKDPRQKEYVALVRESGQHLLDVVTSILDVSRIESGAYSVQPEAFRFSDAVGMCQSMMQLQAEKKGIVLETRLGPDIGEIAADRRAVQQILINLVSNAVKFTPDHGNVVIGASRVGSRLHFWVSDTGIGIAADDLAKLGQPFMQIQNDYTRRFEGTGLGLSLVKGLVELHDGTMSVESAPGMGTKVSVSLPVDGPRDRPAKPVVLPMTARTTKEERDGSLRKTA